MMSTSRCTGLCCLAFPLPITPEEIQEALDGNGACRNTEGIDQWGNWLRHLGFYTRHPVADRGVALQHEGMHYYTCRKFIGGDCTVYEDRPHFCRSYGISVPCEHSACTWADAETPKDKNMGVDNADMVMKDNDEAAELEDEDLDGPAELKADEISVSLGSHNLRKDLRKAALIERRRPTRASRRAEMRQAAQAIASKRYGNTVELTPIQTALVCDIMGIDNPRLAVDELVEEVLRRFTQGDFSA